MKKICCFILPLFVYAGSPFDVPKPQKFDLSVFDTKSSQINEITSENKKIKCRYVCDKKVYKEKEIGDAVSFYKNAQEYTFKK